VQEPIPDSESVPVKPMGTARLYHPFLSGTRPACPLTPVGSVESYFSPKVRLLWFPARSLQVPVNDAVAESGPE
jgi:hypothetical protein